MSKVVNLFDSDGNVIAGGFVGRDDDAALAIGRAVLSHFALIDSIPEAEDEPITVVRQAPTCKGCGEQIVRDWTPTDGLLREYHAGCRPGAGRIPYVRPEACCFERCSQVATHKAGGEVYFPMCAEHHAYYLDLIGKGE